MTFREQGTTEESMRQREGPGWLRPELHESDEGQQASELDLVPILAHDLRNYITPLCGRIGIIAKRAAADGRDHDARLAIDTVRVLDQMLGLVTNVLDLARDQRGILDLALAPVNVCALARQMADLLAHEERPIVADVPQSLIVRAGAARLRQALHNLLANALHYAPAHTPVELGVRRDWRAAGAAAVVTVRDHGPGIPPESLPRLFERFAPGPTSTGLGIGLCLANQIVAAHSGTLAVRPVEGRGACFELTLPLSDA